MRWPGSGENASLAAGSGQPYINYVDLAAEGSPPPDSHAGASAADQRFPLSPSDLFFGTLLGSFAALSIALLAGFGLAGLALAVAFGLDVGAHLGLTGRTLVFDPPFATVTGKGETFSIPDPPPGSHEVRYWHDGVVNTWKTVEVRDGAPTQVSVELE